MGQLPERLQSVLSEKYRIEYEIGAGGMATVYAAEDLKHRRRVAIKVMKSELGPIIGPEQFLREIEIAAGLRHPHILPVYDSGESDGFLYYVMPWVEGESLRDRLNREKQLSIQDAVQITREVADAMSYAHEVGVIHRDIKPENIMLERGHAVVADFGIARAISAAGGVRLTETGLAIGTPAYMSPEQTTGSDEIDGRSDLYSLGCVLHEMLVGQPPFTGSTAESIMRQHLALEPASVTVLRPAVPRSLASVVARSLVKTPADRFQSASEFDAALVAPSARSLDWSPSTRRKILVGSLGALALLGGLTVWVLRPDTGRNADRSTLSSASPPPVIAVLPFANLSEREENEYFSDGMTEDILTQLSQIGTLRVISHQSMMQYKGTDKSVREIAAELGASHIVDGSVRRAAQSVRITAQLIDARDDRPIWANQYDRELSAEAIFNIQSEIAREIAMGLETTLSPDVERRPVHVPTGDLTAYDYYLQGNERVRGGTREDIERAIAFYRQAIAQDPAFALAYSALGVAFTALVGATDAPAYWLDSAESAARRALELDSLAPESHSTMALVYWNTGRMAQAVDMYRDALALRPNDPMSLWGLAFAIWQRGELDAALETMMLVERLDPATLSTYALLGRCYMSLGEFPEAERAFRRALQLQSDDTWAHEDLIIMYLIQGEVGRAAQQLQTLGVLLPGSAEFLSSAAAVAIWRGDYDGARESLEQMIADYPENQFLPLGELGYVTAKLGDNGRAVELWREARENGEAEDQISEDLFWAAVELGRTAAAADRPDEAMQWLERSYQRGWRGWPTIDIQLDPLFENLRDDPRFENLRRRILDDVERMRLRVSARAAESR